MGEIVYSLNGKKFKDYGIYISASDGLFDELKQKKQETYSWAEYHGQVFDVTQKPKFEPREITLTGWIMADDWEEMQSNFDSVFGEFRKAGKQRLLIEPFGISTLVYDVNLKDGIDLKKTFKDGQMFGYFSLKMIEYNPVKKILTITGTSLSLAFKTPKWVEVNIDGAITTHKGTVSITRPLAAGKHYISIAGNIEEITGLTTNATVLWQRL